MVLTGMFSLSLSGFYFSDAVVDGGLNKSLLSACLFILIGVCIDFGKYLFWSERKRSYLYGVIALVLTGFSLLASCAFFLSSEFIEINKSRLVSMEYKAFQEKVDAVKQEINYHERLLEKRLNSEYHQQWVEGEKNAERIRELKGSLIKSMELSVDVGRDVAIQTVPITRFFTVLGRVFDVSTELVRNIFYGLLALLLEVITLGAISLANSVWRDERIVNTGTDNDTIIETTMDDPEARKKMACLADDIIQGRAQPVIRKIKAASYALNIDQIRQVLMNLYLAGVIEKDSRNSYKLTESE